MVREFMVYPGSISNIRTLSPSGERLRFVK